MEENRDDSRSFQNQLADSVHSNEELLAALQSSSAQTEDVYEVLKVERASTQVITDYIVKKLGKLELTLH